MRKMHRSGGFTLVEVMVALGIAGGALLLVLSANNGSLRKSVGSREELRLVRAAETQYEACLLGIETAVSGDLDTFEGWRWEVFRVPTYLGDLRKLRSVEFVVRRPDGSKAVEWKGLREIP